MKLEPCRLCGNKDLDIWNDGEGFEIACGGNGHILSVYTDSPTESEKLWNRLNLPFDGPRALFEAVGWAGSCWKLAAAFVCTFGEASPILDFEQLFILAVFNDMRVDWRY
jgi:hypothetical protein